MRNKMDTKDKRFPIIFMIAAIVLTFGVFLINSLKLSVTGHVLGGSGALVFALPWILLIVFALVVGVFVLNHGKK